MNGKKNDGGQAFPRSWTTSWGGEISNESEPGMSLRDWFAGQALNGWLASSNSNSEARLFHLGDGMTEDIAFRAYAYADAMLEARK